MVIGLLQGTLGIETRTEAAADQVVEQDQHDERGQVDAEPAQRGQAVFVVERRAAHRQRFVLFARHDHDLQPDLVHVGLVFLRAGDGDDVAQAAVLVHVQALVHQVDAADDEVLQLGQVLQLRRVVGQHGLQAVELAVELTLGRAQRTQVGLGAGQVIAAQTAFRIGHEQVEVLELGSHAVGLRLTRVRRLQFVQIAHQADAVEHQDQDADDTQQGLVQRKAADRPELGVGSEVHPRSFLSQLGLSESL